MPTPFNFDAVLANFRNRAPVEVVTTRGQYIDGRWVEAEPEEGPRQIMCVVLALNPQTLALYAEGNIVDGGIAVWTKEEFFIRDPRRSDIESRQTFVNYQGRRYRAVGDGLVSGGASLLGNMNINLYHCLRYFE